MKFKYSVNEIKKMRDKVGSVLLDKRIKTVLPHIEGYLLDIGCGTNKLVKTYSGKGVGVDVYQWGDVDLVVENTANLPFNEQTFDTVTIIAALNFIPNREEVLKEIRRVLKDSGKLIVTMIPPKISRVWLGIGKPWHKCQLESGMKQSGQVYGFTENSISKLLSEADFEIKFRKKFMLGINTLTIAKKIGK